MTDPSEYVTEDGHGLRCGVAWLGGAGFMLLLGLAALGLLAVIR